MAWKKLSQLYFHMKNWEKAKFCFSKVLKVNP
ncbi:MAG: tetratricopeptide repeat protein [Candidatus Hodarchaeota archaeon]